jgi:hypothetical protein
VNGELHDELAAPSSEHVAVALTSENETLTDVVLIRVAVFEMTGALTLVKIWIELAAKVVESFSARSVCVTAMLHVPSVRLGNTHDPVDPELVPVHVTVVPERVAVTVNDAPDSRPATSIVGDATLVMRSSVLPLLDAVARLAAVGATGAAESTTRFCVTGKETSPCASVCVAVTV